MALNGSGPISIGGATTGQSINLELGLAASYNSSMNDAAFRTLAGVASGTITLSDFYGKSNSIDVELLVVAGGGGGCIINSVNGGGGGGGGLIRTTTALPIGVTSISVGGGGASGVFRGVTGGDSIVANTNATIQAWGGGGGGGIQPGFYDGGAGGSGGGSGGSNLGGVGGVGVVGQGYAGGSGDASGYGAGGGGAGGVGVAGSAQATGGGPGVSDNITGTLTTYASGGNSSSSVTSNPPANTGKGGGESNSPSYGYGSSGIVVIRYPNTERVASATSGSPTYVNSGGYHIYTFTASGSITF